jgi:hypothetical protein
LTRRPARHADGRWEASAQEGSGKCKSNQARAKQDETGHGHGEEEFVPHGTPPIAMECWSPSRLSRVLAQTERLTRSTVKRIARRCGNWNLTDALEQQGHQANRDPVDVGFSACPPNVIFCWRASSGMRALKRETWRKASRVASAASLRIRLVWPRHPRQRGAQRDGAMAFSRTKASVVSTHFHCYRDLVACCGRIC